MPLRASLVAQWLKNPFADTGDVSLIPGSGIFPGEGNGNPLQCSCLGNPVDRGAWQATVRGIAESETTEQLDTHKSQVALALD